MKIWDKMFSGKKEVDIVAKTDEIKADEPNGGGDAFPKEEKIDPESEKILKAQDEARTEPLKGTEKEIEQKAEEGMKAMGFEEAQSGKFKPRIRGNDYCPCGSNKKFKKCCAKDERWFNALKKKFDIRLETSETIRNLKNERNRKVKKEKVL